MSNNEDMLFLNPEVKKKERNFLNLKINRKTSEKLNTLSYSNLITGQSSGKHKIGRWKKEEHIRFIKGCFLHRNNWKKVILLI